MNKRIVFCLFYLASVLMVCSNLSHVMAEDAKKTIEDEIQSTKKDIEDIRNRIESIKLQEGTQASELTPEIKSYIANKIDKLEAIEIFYQRQLKALQNQVELIKEEKSLLENNTNGELIPISRKPPFPLSFYDEYLNRLTEGLQQKETLEIEKNLAEKTLENTMVRLKEAQQEVRFMNEQMQAEEGPLKKAKLKQELELNRLEEELASAIVRYKKIYSENIKKSFNMAVIKHESLQNAVNYISGHLFYDPVDFRKEIDDLDRRKNELQNEKDELIRAQQGVDKQWLKASTGLDRTTEQNRPVAEAALKASEMWREAYQRKINFLDETLAIIDEQKEIMKKRYELLRIDVEYEKITQWKKEIRISLDRIQKLSDLQQRYQNPVRIQLTKIYENMTSDTISSQMYNHLKSQFEALKTISDANFFYLAQLNLTGQLYQRLMNELVSKQSGPSLWQRIQPVFLTARDVWRFEILAIDEQSITVGKVIIALTILGLGIFLSNIAIRIIQKRILHRLKIGENVIFITEKLTYYFMLLMVILIALRIVNIPLTVFTFFGGALAIGIGFGAQKLLGNFISGFIIMFEQPIKVGDVIEMENIVGVVEDIGIRCTRVRTFQSIHVLVPNSFFLENSVINWTHNNNNVRAQVTVGIAYGSPTRKVKQLLLKAVSEHNRIHKRPEPFVLFNDFGDNALIFDVFFWITVYKLIDRKLIESDVRFIIDELFRQSDIVIAFPQRDVHFDNDKPLKVEVVDNNTRHHTLTGSPVTLKDGEHLK